VESDIAYQLRRYMGGFTGLVEEKSGMFTEPEMSKVKYSYSLGLLMMNEKS
jgi:hypothetical protein